MRGLIESLTPDGRRFFWIWVGGMFAFYVVLMIGAAGAFVGHQSTRNLAHGSAATVKIERNLAISNQASLPIRQAARYN